MKQTIDYSGIQDIKAKEAKALADVKFYLGPKLHKTAIAELSKVYVEQGLIALELFLGIQGYSAKVFAEKYCAKRVRPLYAIAADIYANWKPIHPWAEPYVNALSGLSSINDSYHYDSGREIVARFLSNARTWKGEDARRIKSELNALLS